MRYLSLLFILIFSANLFAESDYTLGEGLQLGSMPIYIGGYVSIDYRGKKDEDRYRLDDIAFLSYGNYKDLSYLLEVEFKSFYVKTYTDNGSFTTRDQQLYTERAYIDYDINENYFLRAGKYNSPIGFWNLLPVNVLRETSSSPISTEILFPRFTTGIDLNYSSYSNGELVIDLMLQENPPLDDDYNNYHITSHYALGVAYEKNDLTLKLNTGYFYKTNEFEDSGDFYYAMLSAKYEGDDYQLMAEMGSQRKNTTITTRYAGYIQGAYRFTEQHIGIVRVESFDDSLNNKKDSIAIFGYTYRPVYPIALKSEYQFHSQKNDNQLLFSLSVLF